MKPNAEPTQSFRIEVGVEARCKGRSEIPAPAGSGEEIGVVTGRPQSSRGSETADAIRPERDCGKENQSVPEVPHLFLGSHPVDDRRRP